ncbi:MAG TPA: DNA alkylation repair protein, partial [Gemmatimonadaceae bacterium]|nr:DNA alkylation repair protein [Gemmatimonadaceae bacterium]
MKRAREAKAKPARDASTLAAIRAELHELGDPVRGTHSQRFFKTGPGQYGEGDKFLGLTVPEIRGIVRKYRELDDAAVLKLLSSSWHEERLVALLLMVEAYDRGDDPRRA